MYSPSTCRFVPSNINTLLLDRRNDRGEYPIGVSEDNYGNKKKKYKASIKFTREYIKVLKYFNAYGIEIGEFSNVKEASKKLLIPSSHIWYLLKNEKSLPKTFIWESKINIKCIKKQNFV